MNNVIYLIILASLASSCEMNERPADDYVLIEFASKLEEDYEKLKNDKKEKIAE